MEAIFVTEEPLETVPAPDLKGWEESDELVCRTCGDAVMTNPGDPNQIGCGKYGLIASPGSMLFKAKRDA